MRTIDLPSASKTGRTRSKTFSGPPHMMERVAFMAPVSPPLTGASMNWTPAFWSFLPISMLTLGEIVLMSATISAARRVGASESLRASTIPSEPQQTSATSGELGSMVMTRSLLAPTSQGVFAATAPCATSSSTGAGLLLLTVSAKPAFSRLRAMGLPMTPRPMNPIRRMGGSAMIRTSFRKVVGRRTLAESRAAVPVNRRLPAAFRPAVFR